MRISFTVLLYSLLMVSLVSCSGESREEKKEQQIRDELNRGIEIKIEGNVRANDTGDPIAGVQAKVMAEISGDDDILIIDMGLTDSNGSFSTNNAKTVCRTTKKDDANEDEKEEGGEKVIEWETRIAPGACEIQPDSFKYYLYLSDPKNNYFENTANTVFAVVPSTLAFKDLQMVNKNPKSPTDITAIFLDAKSDEPIAGVIVSVMNGANQVVQIKDNEGKLVNNVTSDIEGKVLITGIYVDKYFFEYNGIALETDTAPIGYIYEKHEITLANQLTNDFGPVRLMPQSEKDDVSIIMSWHYNNSPQFKLSNLDLELNLPKKEYDVNSLFNYGYKLEDSIHTITPGSGFAAGTAYWPSMLGGDDEGRLFLDPFFVDIATGVDLGEGKSEYNYDYSVECPAEGKSLIEEKGRVVYCVNGQDTVGQPEQRKIVEIVRDSQTGKKPEVVTIYQDNLQSKYPSQLAYYYDASHEIPDLDENQQVKIDEQGSIVLKTVDEQHYPVGVISVLAVLEDIKIYDDGSVDDGKPVPFEKVNQDIFKTKAIIKVYKGKALVGQYSLSDIELPMGEPLKNYWNPFVIEYGFKNANPTKYDDLYFRIVPTTSFDNETIKYAWAFENIPATTIGMQQVNSGVVDEGELLVSGSLGEGCEADSALKPNCYGLWAHAWSGSGYAWQRLEKEEFPIDFQVTAIADLNGTNYVGGVHHGKPGKNLAPIFDAAYDPFICADASQKNLQTIEAGFDIKTMRTFDGFLFIGTLGNGLKYFNESEEDWQNKSVCIDGAMPDDASVNPTNGLASVSSGGPKNIYAMGSNGFALGDGIEKRYILGTDQGLYLSVAATADGAADDVWGGIIWKKVTDKALYPLLTDKGIDGAAVWAMAKYRQDFFFGTAAGKGIWIYRSEYDEDLEKEVETWNQVTICPQGANSLAETYLDCFPQYVPNEEQSLSLSAGTDITLVTDTTNAQASNAVFVTSMTEFEKKLFVGTNLGVFVYDHSAKGTCGSYNVAGEIKTLNMIEPIKKADCDNSNRRPRWYRFRFPAIYINDFVVHEGVLYAFTSKGIAAIK